MKQKLFTRPVSIVLSIEMFDQIKAVTDQRNIGISDYIREAIQVILKSNIKENGYGTE
jgi:hypothetical protein